MANINTDKSRRMEKCMQILRTILQSGYINTEKEDFRTRNIAMDKEEYHRKIKGSRKYNKKIKYNNNLYI